MNFFRAQCTIIESVHLAMHERRNRRIDEAMPFELRAAAKCSAHQAHAKVPAFARARVPRMRRAVIGDVELQRRKLLFKRRPQARHAFRRHALCTGATIRRDSHAICAPMNTKVAAVKPNTLKLTQVRSLALKAITRLRTPRKP